MNIIAAITQMFRVGAEYLGWKREKSNRENAPDVRAAEIGRDQAKLKDRIGDELEDEELTLIRKRNSE